MLVEFNSDFIEGDLGFDADFSAVPGDTLDSGCGSPRVVKKEAVISSRGYPSSFKTNPGDKCIWNIEAPAGKRILLDFINFRMTMEGENELRIYDGTNMDKDRYHAFDVYKSPKDTKVLTSTNKAIIEVKVWNPIQYDSKGFLANVHFIGPNDTANYPEAINLDLEEYGGYCGLQKILPTFLAPGGRIVGGNESIPNSWPWQVNLRTHLKPITKVVCGGTIVAPSWIVSAGHCAHHKELYAFAGDHNQITSDYKMQITKVKTKIIHEDFQSLASWDNDISLMEVENPFTFTDYVRPACVPTMDVEFPNGTVCYATGWGQMKEGDLSGTPTLHEAPIPIITRQKCAEIYVTEFTDSMICAGYLKGGIDACQGDSGGPLMCHKPGDYNWVLYGITSWGWGCGRENYPGVYARVTKYGVWFESKTNSQVQRNYNNSGPIPTSAPTVPPPPVPTLHDIEETTFDHRICDNAMLMEGGRGGISSPGHPETYPNSLNCTWVIRASNTAALVKIYFREFDIALELSVMCNDYLLVTTRDLYKNTTSREKYCGSVKPSVTTGYSVVITFISGQSEGGQTGFFAEYEDIDPCGDGPLLMDDDAGGIIFSPNYPEVYPKNMRCTWLIPSRNMNIGIHFEKLKLTASTDGVCTEKVTVISDSVLEHNVHGPYCDGSSPIFVDVVGNATVMFESANLGAEPGSGFMLTYEHYTPFEIFQNSDCFSLYFVDENGNFTGSKQKSNEEVICKWTFMGTLNYPFSLTITPWPDGVNIDCEEYYVTVAYGNVTEKICLTPPVKRSFVIRDEEVEVEFSGAVGDQKIGFDGSVIFVTQSNAFLPPYSLISYMFTIVSINALR